MPKPLRDRLPKSSVEATALRTTDRRQFSAADKRRILQAADACIHGELGALLRREGIYHSQLKTWRRQLAAAAAGLEPQRPGPAPRLDEKDRQIEVLNQRIAKLERELAIVNGLVELQKKVQAMVGAMPQHAPPCTP